MSALDYAVPEIAVVPPGTHQVRAQGPFQLRRIRPGIELGLRDDAGFGGLGLIDHAKLLPGMVVGMHEHRNDEIISYMRRGQMQHTDSAGRSEIISSDRLMVMNSGYGFSHEERVVSAEPIEMLQIFVRPSQANLEPGVQFIELEEVERSQQWRLLAGPVGSAAPGFVRQAVYLYDARLTSGGRLALPEIAGFDRWLYVFSGDVTVSGKRATTNVALMIGADRTDVDIVANASSDLVVFLVDRQARYSREGTMSG